MPDQMSLTGGAGGAAGPASGTSNNGLSLPMNTPFNFDSSGWNVNFGSAGNLGAQGSTGANAAQITSTPSATSSGSGASGSTGGGGMPMYSGMGTAGINASMPRTMGGMLPILLGALGLYLVLAHKL